MNQPISANKIQFVVSNESFFVTILVWVGEVTLLEIVSIKQLVTEKWVSVLICSSRIVEFCWLKYSKTFYKLFTIKHHTNNQYIYQCDLSPNGHCLPSYISLSKVKVLLVYSPQFIWQCLPLSQVTCQSYTIKKLRQFFNMAKLSLNRGQFFNLEQSTFPPKNDLML